MLSPGALQALPLGDYLEYLLVTLLLGGVGGFEFFRNLIRARIIEDTPTSRIRSAAQGYVELVGRCAPYQGNGVQGRLTGEPCLWYRFEVARYESSRHGGRWRKIDGGASSEWFQLDDGTGVCVVDPAGAEVTPATKDVWYGDSRWPVGRARRGLGLLGARYRYTEERLHAGEQAYVLGDFRTVRTDRKAAATSRVVALLAALKRDRRRLVAAYDTNADGDVDLAEWEAARRDVQRQVASELAREPVPPPVHRIGRTGQRRRPFLIACRSQRALARRYRIRSGVAAVVALAGNSATLWLLHARFVAG